MIDYINLRDKGLYSASWPTTTAGTDMTARTIPDPWEYILIHAAKFIIGPFCIRILAAQRHV